MSTDWYYYQDNHQYGPVSMAELKQLATAGQLHRDDFVWTEGWPDWVPAGSITGLFRAPPVRVAAESVLIESYSVAYRGGHPDYPKEKGGFIEFDVFSDRFELSPTRGTKRWFTGLVIPFDSTYSLEIVERQLGTVEGILGGLNSRQHNQRNNIHIRYQLEDGNEVLLRLEMLSGITVMGQAKKCQELLDRLRTNGIFEKFCPKAMPRSAIGTAADDIAGQIEKLAALRDKGIISDEEFAKKKAELLKRM